MSNQSITPELLQQLSPLSELEEDSLHRLVGRARQAHFPGGTNALDFDWSNKVVYLLDGQIKLGFPEGGTQVVVGGGRDALSPLGRVGVYPVNVRAITAIDLLWFDENELDVLVTWNQIIPCSHNLPLSQSHPDWRMMSGIFDVRSLAYEIFASLPPANIELLLACFQRQSVSSGEEIVKQHERGDYYYVIESGRATVTREIAGARIELAQLHAGDVFGEEALIAEMPRNATVTMKTEGELLRLDGSDFVRLLREPLLHRIEADEAVARADAGAVWVDVRFPAEFRHDGLPGAVNLPLNELREALPNLAKDKDYVVYCKTGRRSSAAAFLLSQKGLHAFLLSGGMKALGTMEKSLA